MTSISRSALVPYTPAQMFDVVNDVESYPQFLPWCSQTELISETEHEMVARLEIARGGLRQSFSTHNRLVRPSHIHIDLIDGPFTRLAGDWRFEALGEDGCKVSLDLDFEMDSRLINMTLGKVFGAAADRMVDAFCERAESLYG